MNIQAYMAKYPKINALFAPLAPEDLAKIEIVPFEPKDYLIRKGDMGTGLYLIIEGVCESISMQRPTGFFFPNYKMGSMDFTGLSELLETQRVSAKRPTSIMAKTTGVAARIQAQEFRGWMQRYPDTFLTILRLVIQQIHDSREVLVDCNVNNSYLAGVYYLCHLYDVYSRSCPADSEGRFCIRETQQDIGNYIGCDVRSIGRVLNRLRREDAITISRGKIFITPAQYQQLVAIRGTFHSSFEKE